MLKYKYMDNSNEILKKQNLETGKSILIDSNNRNLLIEQKDNLFEFKEKDTENSVTRHSEIRDGKRIYIYSVKNKEGNNLSSGFMEADGANGVDDQTKNFLEKYKEVPYQIPNSLENISPIQLQELQKEARVAMLSGVISRKEYNELRIKFKSIEENSKNKTDENKLENKVVEEKTLQDSEDKNKVTFERDQRIDKLSEGMQDTLDEIENRISQISRELPNFDNAIRRLENDFLDLNMSNKDLDTSIGFSIKTYENFISPILIGVEKNLSKNVNEEIISNRNILRTEISSLKSKLEQSTNEDEKRVLNEQIQKLNFQLERVMTLVNKRSAFLGEFQKNIRKIFELFDTLEQKKFFSLENKDKFSYVSRLENKKNEFYQFLQGIRE